MIEILAYHGWGHDSDSWSKLLKLISVDVQIQTYDRGYFFNNEVDVSFSKQIGKKILMCHSFGLHQIPRPLFKQLDGIILISSFIQFGKPKVLDRMIDSLKTNTALVLGQFHANCSYPSQSNWIMPRVFNKNKLIDDLEKLASSTFDIRLIPERVPKLLVAGDSDKIVDPEAVKALSKALKTPVTWLEKTGHGSIYTKAENCSLYINRFLEQLENE